MGSIREDIATKILDDRHYFLTDKIISLVCKRIEGVENPYKDEICNSYTHLKSDVYLYVIEAARDCFEEARQAILDVIKEE